MARGDRVRVGVQRDSELLGDVDLAHACEVEPGGVEPLEVQALLVEHIDGPALRGAVHAHVGHRVHPQLRGRLHRREVDELLAGEEILLDEADAVLDTALLPTRGDVAGGDLKAPMAGEVEVLGVEDGHYADQALEHGGLQVVDHQARWHGAERGEGVLVAGEEEFHFLRHGELQVHAPAVAQHHQEEAQTAGRVAHPDGAV